MGSSVLIDNKRIECSEKETKSLKVLVIIPCYNEEASIESTVESLITCAPEVDFIIVNDGSQDDTYKVCRDNHYPVLDLPFNLGIGGCMQAGYLYAYKNSYDLAIQHDGDGQHDPCSFVKVISPIQAGHADIVIGSRFIDHAGYRSSGIRRFGITFLSRLIHLCSGYKIHDVTSGYRAVNREYIELFASRYAQDYPEPEAIIEAAKNGARIAEVPVVMYDRKNGKSSIRSFRSIYYMIKVSLAIILHQFIMAKKG